MKQSDSAKTEIHSRKGDQGEGMTKGEKVRLNPLKLLNTQGLGKEISRERKRGGGRTRFDKGGSIK